MSEVFAVPKLQVVLKPYLNVFFTVNEASSTLEVNGAVMAPEANLSLKSSRLDIPVLKVMKDEVQELAALMA